MSENGVFTTFLRPEKWYLKDMMAVGPYWMDFARLLKLNDETMFTPGFVDFRT